MFRILLYIARNLRFERDVKTEGSKTIMKWYVRMRLFEKNVKQRAKAAEEEYYELKLFEKRVLVSSKIRKEIKIGRQLQMPRKKAFKIR